MKFHGCYHSSYAIIKFFQGPIKSNEANAPEKKVETKAADHKKEEKAAPKKSDEKKADTKKAAKDKEREKSAAPEPKKPEPKPEGDLFLIIKYLKGVAQICYWLFFGYFLASPGWY